MIGPDDPRHGSNRGYLAGCRNTCCRTAHANYRRNLRTRQYLARGPLLIDGTGTRRRVRSLMALGWTGYYLDDQLGQKHGYVSKLATREGPVVASTASKVARLYDRLSMRLPTPQTTDERRMATRTRNHARSRGWPVPLAWNDIDDTREQPRNWAYTSPNRADAFRDLVDMGAGISDVCARLKVSRDGLEKWCQRHHMSHLFRELVGRETAVFTYANQHTGGAA